LRKKFKSTVFLDNKFQGGVGGRSEQYWGEGGRGGVERMAIRNVVIIFGMHFKYAVFLFLLN
jgi:hypothetical protein